MPTCLQNPNPTVALVTADPLKRVTAVVNAGPTAAGLHTGWWEVELVQGSTEILVTIDRTTGLDFSSNRNHTDTFIVPLGMSFNGKRIRYALHPDGDSGIIWRSPYATMEGVNFSNVPTASLDVPGVPAGVTTAVASSVQQQALTEAARLQERTLALDVELDSRYKLASLNYDADEPDKGAVFGPLPVLEDFYRLREDYRLHRMGKHEIGFLDRLATKFYGEGREGLWWSIAYANAIIDPETDTVPNQAIQVPTQEAAVSYLARSASEVA